MTTPRFAMHDLERGQRRDSPWIKVHELAEFVFCPRAGLIAHELGRDDAGEEFEPEGAPRLDWLPDYDAALIDERLQQFRSELSLVTRWGTWLAVVMIVIFLLGCYRFSACISLPLLVVAGRWSVQQGALVRQLARRQSLASAAAAAHPSLENLRETPWNWWQLRQAGFSLTKPQEPYRDEELHLAGKPFLILQYQSLRIPVIRKHRGKHEVHDSHRVRVAAYCRLIEQCEGALAPYGIVLFADSYEVMIVPNTQAGEARMARSLSELRATLEDAEHGELPTAPPPTRCQACPWGRPLAHVPGRTDSHLEVLPGAYTPRFGVDRRQYHSVCGDRFEWLPRHEKAKDKGLAGG